MIDPVLFSELPFGDLTAFSDFVGTNALYHRALAQTAAAGGFPYRTFPLGDFGSGPEWLHALNAQMVAACAALGITGPTDVASYNLNDPNDFASFTLAYANDLRRLRTAVGVS